MLTTRIAPLSVLAFVFSFSIELSAWAQTNSVLSPPFTLSVIPKDTHGHRIESSWKELKYFVSTIKEDGSLASASGAKEDTITFLAFSGHTNDYRIDKINADSVVYTRQQIRIIQGQMDAPLLDTDDPRFALARGSPLLHTPEMLEENADGSLRRYKATGPNPAVNSAWQILAEHRMENGETLLPDHAVRIGESWSMGTLEVSDPRFGVLTRDIEGKLVKTVVGGMPGLARNEVAAVIEVRGSNPRHKLDNDSAIGRLAVPRIAQYEEKGLIVFSLDRREVVTDDETMNIIIDFGGAWLMDKTSAANAIRFSISLRTSRGRGTIEQMRQALGIVSPSAIDQSWCESQSKYFRPDLIILDCTAKIQSGHLAGNNLATAFQNRGNAFKRTVHYDQAIADFDVAIRLQPNRAQAFVGRGTAYYEKGNYDHAIADYSEALRIDATFSRAYFHRGNCYYEKKDYDRAIADYSKVIELEPKDVAAYNNRAALYLKKRDYDRAIADSTEAIRLDPAHASAFYNRGMAKRLRGDVDGGEADLEEAKRIDPDVEKRK